MQSKAKQKLCVRFSTLERLKGVTDSLHRLLAALVQPLGARRNAECLEPASEPETPANLPAFKSG